MGKKNKSRSDAAAGTGKDAKAETANTLPFLAGNASVDPALASLFEQSAGPVKAPSLPVRGTKNSTSKIPESEDDEEMESFDGNTEEEGQAADGDELMGEAAEESPAGSEPAVAAEGPNSEGSSRKRKRAAAGDNLEEAYMRRIAKEEEKEAEKRRAEKAKRPKLEGKEGDEEVFSDASKEDEVSDEDDEETVVPMHESQTGDAEAQEIDKSNRTVFLGNVSTQAIKSKSAKKTLLKHLGSFLSTLPESKVPHKIESIRFRSTPFASGGGVPKRASFARRELLDETTPSTNAYVVYSTIQAARKAPAALNGTVVLDRHIRVDSVAHPAENDHKRCVFVGNLDFVGQEADDEDKKKKKPSAPADIEEGLWRTFNAEIKGSKEKGSTKGNVESVRVIRDSITRVGKGFAYVQFYDENCVEEALLLDGKKFPPMLPRKLRVTRAKKLRKRKDGPDSTKQKVLGVGSAQKTLQGRANRLFGRAGAAKLKSGDKGSKPFVFEGQRASEGDSRFKVKTKSRGSKGKPKNRSSRRAAAYKAAGGKKEKAGN